MVAIGKQMGVPQGSALDHQAALLEKQRNKTRFLASYASPVIMVHLLAMICVMHFEALSSVCSLSVVHGVSLVGVLSDAVV